MDIKLRVFFYSLVAVSLFFKTKRISVIVFLILLLYLIKNISTAFSFYFTSPLHHWLDMVTNPIIFEFILGYIFSEYQSTLMAYLKKIPQLIFKFIFLICLLFIYFEVKTLPFTGEPHVDIMLLPSLLIFLCLVKFYDINDWSKSKIVIFTAKISYSIYLLHMAAMFSVIYFGQNFFGEDVFSVFANRFNLFFIALLLTWGFSTIFHYTIEVWVAKKIKKLLVK